MKTSIITLVLCVFFALNMIASTGLVSADTVVEKWGVFELTISDTNIYNNPFWDVTLTALFTGPQGEQFTMNGFYYDSSLWKVRFSPTAIGTWSYQVNFNSAKSTKRISGSFLCTAPDIDDHGFIGVNPISPHKFKCSDGTIFIPMGTAGHTPAIEAAFLGISPGPQQVPAMWDTLTRYSINTFRLMLFHQSGFEVPLSWNTDETTGNFFADSGGLDRYNTFVGKVMDRWFKQAQNHNIAIYLCLLTGFDISDYPFSTSVWSTNNGGPYPSLNEMYQTNNSVGLSLEKKYFAYLVSRYSAYRNIVVWEYNNEYGYYTSPSWIASMDSVIRANDPYNRARTVSFWDAKWSKNSSVDAQSGVTVTDDHFYSSSGGYTGFNADSASNAQANHRYATYNKPVMIGELGGDQYVTTKLWQTFQRVAFWGAFTGGGYPLFWLSGGNSNEGWSFNLATIRFINNVKKIVNSLPNYEKMHPDNQQVSVSMPNTVRAFCLSDSTDYLVYFHHFTDHTSTISGLDLSLTDYVEGVYNYSVVWMNASTADTVSSAEGVFSGKNLLLTVPDFTVDLIGLIKLENTTGIDSKYAEKTSLLIFPNPARDVLFIKKVVGPSELFIYSLNGKVVTHEQLTQNKIDITNLAKGIYFLQIRSGKKINAVGKFVKQ